MANPISQHGMYGLTEYWRQRAEDTTNPYQSTIDQLRANTALVQQQAAQSLDEYNRLVAEREAERKRQEEELARQQELAKQEYAAAAAADLATINQLMIPGYGRALLSGATETPQDKDALVPSANSYVTEDAFGNQVALNSQVLAESKDPNAIFREFLKTRPDFMGMSTAGRRKILEEHFPAFVQKVYNLRGQPEKMPDGMTMKQITDSIIKSNKEVLQREDSSNFRQVFGDTTVGIIQGAGQLLNAGAFLGRQAWNWTQYGFNKLTGDEEDATIDLADIDAAIDSHAKWEENIFQMGQALYSNETADMMQAMREGLGFGNTIDAIFSSPWSLGALVGQVAGVGAGGKLVKWGATKVAGAGAKLTGRGAAKAADDVAETAATAGVRNPYTQTATGFNLSQSAAAQAARRELAEVAANPIARGRFMTILGSTGERARALSPFMAVAGASGEQGVYSAAKAQGLEYRDVHGTALLSGSLQASLSLATGVAFGKWDVETQMARMLGLGSSRAGQQAAAQLSNQARQNLQRAAGEVPKQLSRWAKTKPARNFAGTMLAGATIEGAEEYIAGLTMQAAMLGIGEDGNWSTDNITDAEWDKIYDQAAIEGTIGLTVGGMFHTFRGVSHLLSNRGNNTNEGEGAAPAPAPGPRPLSPEVARNVVRDAADDVAVNPVNIETPLNARRRADAARFATDMNSFFSRPAPDTTVQQNFDSAFANEMQRRDLQQAISDYVTGQTPTRPLLNAPEPESPLAAAQRRRDERVAAAEAEAEALRQRYAEQDQMDSYRRRAEQMARDAREEQATRDAEIPPPPDLGVLMRQWEAEAAAQRVQQRADADAVIEANNPLNRLLGFDPEASIEGARTRMEEENRAQLEALERQRRRQEAEDARITREEARRRPNSETWYVDQDGMAVDDLGSIVQRVRQDPQWQATSRVLLDGTYNYEINPEAQAALDAAIDNGSFKDGQLFEQMKENGFSAMDFLGAALNRIRQKGDLETVIHELTPVHKYINTHNLTKMGIANWLMSRYNIPPHRRDELGAALLTTPGFDSMIADVATALTPTPRQPTAKAQNNATIDALVNVQRGRPSPTGDIASRVLSQLEGSGLDVDVMNAINSLYDGHPLKELYTSEIRRSEPHMSDTNYKLWQGVEAPPLPASRRADYNRLAGNSDLARQLYYDTYLVASKMLEQGVHPNRIKMDDQRVEAARNKFNSEIEADTTKTELQKFGYKTQSPSYTKRVNEIQHEALSAAKMAWAEEASNTKKNEAATRAAEDIGYGEKRTRGGKRNVNKVVENAAKQRRKPRAKAEDEPIPRSRLTPSRPRMQSDRQSVRVPGWDELSPRQRRMRVQADVEAYIHRVATSNWDENIANRVRVVSPDMVVDGGKINGFVKDNDPHIYIVAHPDMDIDLINHTIAHEAAHLGMHLRNAEGRDVFSGEAFLNMLNDAQGNKHVRELMNAMRSHYPKADNYLLAEEALAELTAAQMTGRWGDITDKWGVHIPAGIRGRRSAIGKLVDAFKNFVSRILSVFDGKKRIIDQDINRYITRVARNAHSAGQDVDSVTARPSELIKRDQAFDRFADVAIEGYASMDGRARDEALADLAQERGSADLADYYRASARVNPESAKANEDTTGQKTEQKDKRDYNRAHDEVEGNMDIEEILRRHNEEYNKRQQAVDPQQIADEMAVFFYDLTAPNSHRTTDRKGVIIPFKTDNKIVVRYADSVRGADFIPDRTVEYTPQHNESWDDFKRRVEGGIVKQGFEPRDGQRRLKWRVGDVDYDNFMLMKMGRITRWELFSPTFTKLATAIRNVLPQIAEPVLDWVLDMLHKGRAMFVSPEDMIAATENAFNLYAKNGNEQSINLYRLITEARQGFHQQLGRQSTDGKPTFYDMKLSFANAIAKFRDVVTKEEIERHIHAREAQLRDPEIAQRLGITDPANMERLYMPGVPQNTLSGFFHQDGQSGDWAATHYFNTEFAQMSKVKQDALMEIEKEFRRMNMQTLDLMYLQGVIDQGQYINMQKRGFWATLRDHKEAGTTKSPRPAGRYSKPENIIINSIDQMQRNIQTSFNQHLYQRIAQLALLTPNNEYFRVETYHPTREGAGSHDFDYLYDDSAGTKNPYTRAVRMEDGSIVKLTFTGAGRHLVQKRYSTNGVIQAMQGLTSTLGMFKTSLSPSFIAVQGPRDGLTAYLNIQGAIGADVLATKDANRVAGRMLMYAMKYYTPLVKASWNDSYKHDPFLRVYQAEGAGLSFGAQVGYDELSSGFNRIWRSSSDKGIMDRANMMSGKIGQATKRGVKAVAYAPEQMFRIGAMRAYIEYAHEQGLINVKDFNDANSIQAALDANPEIKTRIIEATKDITTNFERKGTTPEVRAFFFFFNAAMQSMFRTVPQIMASEHGRRGVMLLTMAMFMQAMMAIDELGDDEDGESRYFRMNGRDRERYIGNNNSIPLSPDMAIFAVLADSAAGVLTGKRSMLDAAGDMMEAAGRAAVPLNWWRTDDTLLNIAGGLTPGILTGALADIADQNYFGQPLKRKHVFDPVTGKRIENPTALEATPYNASVLGTGIAEILSSIGVDKSGGEVDAWMDVALGGVWQGVRRYQSENGEGGSAVQSAINAVFTGYRMKPNDMAVKNQAQTIADKASKFSRKLTRDGIRTDMTEHDRKNYAAYQEIERLNERAKKLAKGVKGEYGNSADVWKLYVQAKNEGDFIAAGMYRDEYERLSRMQDSIWATITLRAKELGVFDALK